MPHKPAVCVRCKRETSKRKTRAIEIVAVSVFNRTSKLSMRGGSERKRSPSYRVVDVKRICRDVKGCNAVIAKRREGEKNAEPTAANGGKGMGTESEG